MHTVKLRGKICNIAQTDVACEQQQKFGKYCATQKFKDITKFIKKCVEKVRKNLKPLRKREHPQTSGFFVPFQRTF